MKITYATGAKAMTESVILPKRAFDIDGSTYSNANPDYVRAIEAEHRMMRKALSDLLLISEEYNNRCLALYRTILAQTHDLDKFTSAAPAASPVETDSTPRTESTSPDTPPASPDRPALDMLGPGFQVSEL